jgi:hypothetical protein
MDETDPTPALLTVLREAALSTACVEVLAVAVGFEAKYNAATPAT